jgi:hypothetical protein
LEFQLSFFQQTETGSQIREREDEVLILGIPAMLRDYHHTIRCLGKHNGVLLEIFFSFIYREFSQYKMHEGSVDVEYETKYISSMQCLFVFLTLISYTNMIKD